MQKYANAMNAHWSDHAIKETEIPYMVIDSRFLELIHMQMTQKVTNTKGIQATREKKKQKWKIKIQFFINNKYYNIYRLLKFGSKYIINYT